MVDSGDQSVTAYAMSILPLSHRLTVCYCVYTVTIGVFCTIATGTKRSQTWHGSDENNYGVWTASWWRHWLRRFWNSLQGTHTHSLMPEFLRRFFDRVDLIKPVSNVHPSVCAYKLQLWHR